MPRHGQQISLLNRDLWELLERLDPSIDQVAIEIDEV
jgi:hypothetical protein